MLIPFESILKHFREAGYQKNPIDSAINDKPHSAPERVNEIISEFGGLRVGQTGAGCEQAASNIHFYSEANLTNDSLLVEAWNSKIGKLSAFATAHNDHIIIFVSDIGNYYAFTDPDECLYMVGSTFGEAMERILLGYCYGSAITYDD